MSNKDVVTNEYSLLFGDCLERMKEIPDGSVDLILTDPPYGTTACKWDSVIPFEPMWEQLKRVIKPNGAIVLFGSQPFTSVLIASNLKMFKYCWVWNKVRGSNFFAAKFQPLNNTEDIIVFSEGGANNGTKKPVPYYPQGIENCNIVSKNSKSVGGKVGDAHKTTIERGGKYTQTTKGYPNKLLEVIRDATSLHPTQKPVALLEYLIKTYTQENETVLDFTMGSGSTGVAALNTNRRFIGVEMEEKYFDIGANRMQESAIKGEK
jgi:site-specific DNA-methyltransferase (adenine-specific)